MELLILVEGDGTGVFGFEILFEIEFTTSDAFFKLVVLVNFIDLRLLLVAFSKFSWASCAFDRLELEDEVDETERELDGWVMMADEDRLDFVRLLLLLTDVDETGRPDDAGMGQNEDWSEP